jgi:pimeloyl-ACP methyl ester carboxylesterase
MLALLDELGLERVRIIGHDWGGYVAFLLALEHPDCVERMVALDIVPPWPGRPRRPHIALPSLLSYQVPVAIPGFGPQLMTTSHRFIRTIIRVGSGSAKQWSDEELDVYARRLREPSRARASSACYRTFLRRELATTMRDGHRASDLTVSTLLVMGSASILQHALDSRTTPNLRVEWIENAGHFLPEEASSQVLDLAIPFLAG